MATSKRASHLFLISIFGLEQYVVRASGELRRYKEHEAQAVVLRRQGNVKWIWTQESMSVRVLVRPWKVAPRIEY